MTMYVRIGVQSFLERQLYYSIAASVHASYVILKDDILNGHDPVEICYVLNWTVYC